MKANRTVIWLILARIFSVLIHFLQLKKQSSIEKDLEILLLRHQLHILQKNMGKLSDQTVMISWFLLY